MIPMNSYEELWSRCIFGNKLPLMESVGTVSEETLGDWEWAEFIVPILSAFVTRFTQFCS